MTITLAQLLNPPARRHPVRGRVVLGLTGSHTALRGINRTSEQVQRERDLIYAAVKRLEPVTRDQISAETGIDPETVTARLNWMSTHRIVRCWRSRGTAVWRMEDET